jgi:hypothetical protein
VQITLMPCRFLTGWRADDWLLAIPPSSGSLWWDIRLRGAALAAVALRNAKDSLR